MKNSIFSLLLFLVFWSCQLEEPIPTYTLSSSVSPAEAGKITASPSASTYPEGSQVTLTAEPNENWVFKQWEGDQSNTSNPLQVTMTANKTLVAVFVKRDYPLSIKIEGEGTVEEKIVPNPSGREYPHGTIVELTPKPKEGWEFESWSGDLTGNQSPKRITIDKQKNVTVTFKRKIIDVPINGFSSLNKTTSNYVVLNEGKSAYLNFNEFWRFIDNTSEKISSAFAYLDFDKDGDADFVFATTQYSRERQFVYVIENKGNGVYNLWKKLDGFIWPRQAVLGDYDGNGYVDFLVADQGFENPQANDYPGAELGIVYFHKDFAETKLISNSKAFNHTVASGDLDSDGDIDLITADHKYMNNGSGLFLKSDAIYSNPNDPNPINGLGYYHNATADFDNDGKMDVVFGTSEIFGDSIWDTNPRRYNGRMRVYWNDSGNGNLYYSKTTVLPMTYPATKDTFAIIDDYDIIDFNNDGYLDIVNFRSCWRGDGYYIQFLKNNKNRTFSEVTESYIDRYKYNIPNAPPGGFLWLVWIRFVDITNDGFLDLIGREQMGDNQTLKWINDGTNKFKFN